MHRFILCLAFALVAALPAHAADSNFTVKNVPVDATAAASVEAQTIAINGGRPKAWAILYRRLTRQEDWPRQPPLDDAAIGRLIRTFEVSDERRSTTRYVAKVTYVFSQPAVERLLRASNISYVTTQTKRILVIPLSPTFKPGDSWVDGVVRSAFRQRLHQRGDARRQRCRCARRHDVRYRELECGRLHR